MFTKDYREFCLKSFGYFLDHQPFTPWFAGKPGGIYRNLCYRPRDVWNRFERSLDAARWRMRLEQL